MFGFYFILVQYICKKTELHHEPPGKYHQATEIINLLILLLFYPHLCSCLSALSFFEVNPRYCIILYYYTFQYIFLKDKELLLLINIAPFTYKQPLS